MSFFRAACATVGLYACVLVAIVAVVAAAPKSAEVDTGPIPLAAAEPVPAACTVCSPIANSCSTTTTPILGYTGYYHSDISVNLTCSGNAPLSGCVWSWRVGLSKMTINGYQEVNVQWFTYDNGGVMPCPTNNYVGDANYSWGLLNNNTKYQVIITVWPADMTSAQQMYRQGTDPSCKSTETFLTQY